MKLHIMHDTLTNCCHKEIKSVSSSRRRKDPTNQIENRSLTNAAKEFGSQEFIRNCKKGNIPQNNFKLIAICHPFPDIVQSSVGD